MYTLPKSTQRHTDDTLDMKESLKNPVRIFVVEVC